MILARKPHVSPHVRLFHLKKMALFWFSKSYSPLAKKRKQSPRNASDNLPFLRIRSTSKVPVSKPKMGSNLHLKRLSLIVRVNVVLNRSVVVDSD